MLKSREKQLLKILSDNDQWHTYKELSDFFGITKRTIRYDIEKINLFLQENNLPALKISSKNGVSYYNEYNKIILEKMNLNENFYVLNKEERLQGIIIFILANNGNLTIDKIANYFDISRGTVISDIQVLKNEFMKHDIDLTSNIKGYYLLGNEQAIRSYFAKNLGASSSERILHSEADKIIENINIEEINNFIISVEKSLNVEIEEESYYKIFNHIYVSLVRIKCKCYVDFPTENINKLKNTKEFEVIKELIESFKEQIDVNFSINELCYLTILFLSANVNSLNEDFEESAEIYLISKTLILSVSDKMNYSFIQDLTLFKNIANHFKSSLFRLKNGIKVNNPLYESIKNRFSFYFPIIEESLGIIEQLSSIKFNQQEISYFALHFASSMKYSNFNKKKKMGILICEGGSNLLKTSIETLFEIEIVATYSSRKYKDLFDDTTIINYDIIISTSNLASKFYRNVPVVKISPILIEKDIDLIGNYLEYRSKSDVIANQIVNIIKNNCTINNKNGLISDLENIFHDTEIKDMLEYFSLKSLNFSDLIKLDVPCKSYEEGIKLGCNLLQNNNYTKKEYTKKVMQSFEKYSPYFLVQNNIIVSYSMDCSLVYENGISIVRLKSKINDNNNLLLKDVKIIITLCGKTPNYLLKFISELNEYISCESYLNILLNSKNKNSICDYIKNEKEQ